MGDGTLRWSPVRCIGASCKEVLFPKAHAGERKTAAAFKVHHCLSSFARGAASKTLFAMERLDRFATALMAVTRQRALQSEEAERVISDYLKPARRGKQREQADLEVLAGRLLTGLGENPDVEKALKLVRERIALKRGPSQHD
jgi:hypothetical protein